MFALRQINREGLESNLSLGNRYNIVHRDRHPERFKEALGNTVTHPDQEKVYAILIYDGGTDSYPLYEGQYYYIMTESGRTFDNVTMRK
jgi:hypothetical protein